MDTVTLDAFRDRSYPLGVGSYDAYTVPRRGFITRVERTNGRIRLFGDIELVEKHMRSYGIVRNRCNRFPPMSSRARPRSAPLHAERRTHRQRGCHEH